MIISIGIPTEGEPQLERRADGDTVLKNMLIGLGFHWQRRIEAVLPGDVELTADSVCRLINRLPLEKYLECVVGSEMNPDAPVEFLKAHAVISRSWALGKISGAHSADEEGKTDTPNLIVNWEDTCDHNGFDVCSDDHCQRYQGIQPMADSVRDAIRKTAGLALYAPDGSLVDARFSKCCGGRTEVFSSCWQPHEPPCLESFADPWCDLSEMPEERREKLLRAILKDYDLANGGGYRWHTTVSANEVQENLKRKLGRDVGRVQDIQVTQRGKSGRATRLRLTGDKGSLEIGKELMIRRLLAPTHLYSSWIEISKDTELPEKFHIEGRGWGHGVGLCQIGAARMALEGYSFDKILSFYYPGSTIR